ncbi:MAG: AbrB/MazE/SpoVT family DNA-binding domain-containing protein [Rhodospirillales bacterium]|jgi:antitoxin MazE|nr:AbrB/MazE/SpoVT family DNA-binding domain-containing protein [Rhodospirillales bacterium]MDP6884337.1 AbrB/MazE/SpoVT family DNA-binding domain-containing protein [Rhodospirillales bacterium]
MRVKLVSIGNSKGIRIPRAVIRECGFGDQIEMRLGQGEVVLAPVRSAREGWDAAFEKMAAAGDDVPLIPDYLDHDWDETEWEW